MPPKPKPPRAAAPTHFLCIPLVTPTSRPQLAAALAAFRNDLCSSSSTCAAPFSSSSSSPSSLLPSLPHDAIRPLGTLHLTLGVFCFPRDGGNGNGNGDGDGEARLARATQLLRGLRLREIWRAVRREVADRTRARAGAVGAACAGAGAGAGAGEGQGNGLLQQQQQEQDDGGGGGGGDPPRITLRGLASMQPASRAAVLYAPPVDRLGELQLFCERVRDAFRDADGRSLMVDDGRPLLLHATVVNTIYVKGDGGENGNRSGAGGNRRKGGGGRRRERLVFDATAIIDRYEDLVWMKDVPVESVAICRMGAKKVVVDGVEDQAYEVEAEVAF